jgi:hypothetical protein
VTTTRRRLRPHWAQAALWSLGVVALAVLAAPPRVPEVYLDLRPKVHPFDPMDVLSASRGHTCLPERDWPEGEIPAWVVGRTGERIVGMNFDAAWTSATAGTLEVLFICR